MRMYIMNEEQKKENRIQQLMVMWYNNKFCNKLHDFPSMIAHVPNENQHQLVSIGLLPGFSDLLVCHRALKEVKGLHIYFEVKTPTGTQSPKQLEFQKRIEELGFEYYLVRTQEEFEYTILLIDAREKQIFASYRDNA